jgi:hypothetical protein
MYGATFEKQLHMNEIVLDCGKVDVADVDSQVFGN